MAVWVRLPEMRQHSRGTRPTQGQRWTICATAFFLQDLQNKWIRGCFNCKILTKTFVPRKCLLHFACIFTDTLLIIQIKRSRICLCNLFNLFLRNKWCLFHRYSMPSFLNIMYSNFGCMKFELFTFSYHIKWHPFLQYGGGCRWGVLQVAFSLYFMV